MPWFPLGKELPRPQSLEIENVSSEMRSNSGEKIETYEYGGREREFIRENAEGRTVFGKKGGKS